MSENIEAKDAETIEYLCNATRFKVFYDSRQKGCRLYDLPEELAGRWVALVAAENDKHMRYTTPLTVSAAVAAFKRKAAEVCYSKMANHGDEYMQCAESILSIQSDETALREMIERAVDEGIEEGCKEMADRIDGNDHSSARNVIVNRVLKGE